MRRLFKSFVSIMWGMPSKIVTFFSPNPNKKSSVAISPHKSSKKAEHSFYEYDRFMRDAGENARKTLDD